MAEKKQKVINYMPKTSSQKIWDGDTNLSIVYKMFLNKLYANTQEREAEPRPQGISIQRPSRDGMASKEVEHGSMNGEGGRWDQKNNVTEIMKKLLKRKLTVQSFARRTK